MHAGDRIRTGDCDFYFLLPSGGPPPVLAAQQPPRNGIRATVQEPLPQAVCPAANVDMHTGSMRSEYSAAVLQGAADPLQAPTDAHVHAVGPESSSPMDVVRCSSACRGYLLRSSCCVACMPTLWMQSVSLLILLFSRRIIAWASAGNALCLWHPGGEFVHACASSS